VEEVYLKLNWEVMTCRINASTGIWGPWPISQSHFSAAHKRAVALVPNKAQPLRYKSLVAVRGILPSFFLPLLPSILLSPSLPPSQLVLSAHNTYVALTHLWLLHSEP
jgi:hypothetical protein